VGYTTTRYLNAHIDFRTRASGGSYLQHLSELPGYTSSIYSKPGGNGVINLSDANPHSIKIVVRDAYGNTAQLTTTVQWSAALPRTKAVASGKLFYPQMLDGFESDNCEFFIGERCLYDSVRIRYQALPAQPGAASALHAIGQSYIPLQEAFLIRIRPTESITSEEKARTVMQWYAGAKKDVQKVEWQQGWAAARFRDFGFYQLLVDQEAPQIIPSGFGDGADLSRASRIVFTVKDNLDKIKNVRTELDGQWIRFTNDKGRYFIYRFDEHFPSGKHQLKIIAEDEAGNRTERIYTVTR
jgi:hypothetical protein